MKSLKSEIYERVETPFPFLVIALLLLILTLFIGCKVADSNSVKAYNNGICMECGGHLVYQQLTGGYVSKCVYICDKCGNMVMTSRYFKEGETK